MVKRWFNVCVQISVALRQHSTLSVINNRLRYSKLRQLGTGPNFSIGLGRTGRMAGQDNGISYKLDTRAVLIKCRKPMYRSRYSIFTCKSPTRQDSKESTYPRVVIPEDTRLPGQVMQAIAHPRIYFFPWSSGSGKIPSTSSLLLASSNAHVCILVAPCQYTYCGPVFTHRSKAPSSYQSLLVAPSLPQKL